MQKRENIIEVLEDSSFTVYSIVNYNIYRDTFNISSIGLALVIIL